MVRRVAVSLVLALVILAGLVVVQGGARSVPSEGIRLPTPAVPSTTAAESGVGALAADGGMWTRQLSPLPGHSDHAMVYDSAADRVVLFGGHITMSIRSDDTWSYNFTAERWTDMDPTSRPSARSDPAMVYDSAADRILLFGGLGPTGYLNDTWSYDFDTNTWTNMRPSLGPSARNAPGAAYDPASGLFVIFGGRSALGVVADTWSYDSDTNMWTKREPTVAPSAREGVSMASASGSNRIILFGGRIGTGPLNDTWSYDVAANAWTNVTPTRAPSVRFLSPMTYDSASSRIVLFGGAAPGSSYLNDTWSYDVQSNSWTNRAPTTHPSERGASAMAYDSAADRTILFGGFTNSYEYAGDTWFYDFDANTWRQASPSQSPPEREGHAMAYDSAADRTILFGGYDSGYLNDTWAYDFHANTWTSMNPSSAPAARRYFAMTYDSASDRVILFGGDLDSGGANDTWAYDFHANTWTNLNPSSAPSVRGYSAMAYDSAADRTILFGGYGLEGGDWVYLDDTWAYDFHANTWTNVSSSFAPPARSDHGMVYDSVSDRVILFGGYGGSQYLADTWSYDFEANAWRGMATSSPPSARADSVMAYHARADRVVLFGGDLDGADGNDTWSCNIGSGAWSEMHPTSAPSARMYSAMVYDSAADRVILFGGDSSLGEAAVTWSYTHPAVLPPAPQGFLATASESQVALSWAAPIVDGGSPITAYNVYRGTTSGAAALLTTVEGVLTYLDTSLTNGVTYYYQVSAVNTAGEGERTAELSASPLGRPSAPLNLQATAGDGRVMLTWSPPASDGGSPITSHPLYRSTSSGAETLLTTVGPVLTYTDTGLTPGVTYYYQVSAINGQGEGPRSLEASSVPLDTVSPAVAIASPANGATVTSTSLTVTGIAADNVAVAKVEVSLDNATWILATGTTSWSAMLTLAEGANAITARVTDTSGNTATSTVSVTAQAAAGPVGGEAVPAWAWALIAVVAAVAAVEGILLLRRRR